MAQENQEGKIIDVGIEDRLKRIEAKISRVPWIGLSAFGGALFAISLPFWPDWSGFIVAGIGLIFSAVATLLYLQPWRKG